MSRKLFSLAGIFVAVVGFTVGSHDAEARHGGRQRNRCCQQTNNVGCQQSGFSGCDQGCNSGIAPQATNWNGQTSACCNQQPTGNAMRPEYQTPAPVMNAATPSAPSRAPAPTQAPAPAEAPAPAAN